MWFLHYSSLDPLVDALGKKPLLIIAILFAISGTLILGFATSFDWLIIGRLDQGLVLVRY